MKTSFLLSILMSFIAISLTAQTVNVGAASYTTNFPGTDAAGRNSFPSGTPFVVGNAANKTVPTNDWWSKQIKNSHADNLFNYPYTMKSKNEGLVTTYIPWGVIDNIEPVIVGVSGLNASAANISDFTDWTVTMDWQDANHHFQATSGIGMPFLYFTKDSNDIAQITVNQGSVTIQNEILIINNLRNGADFAVYAPRGSSWSQSGQNYTSTLNGKNYWSMAFIPLNASNINSWVSNHQKHAYVFPSNTKVEWQYDNNQAAMTSTFITEVDVKEGTDTTILQGLLPHQWANLAPSSAQPTGSTFRTVRGDLKLLDGNRFSVRNTFHGILPTLPYLNQYSQSFNPVELSEKIASIQNDQLNPWTDSYNEGQMMNRLIQTARIAEQMNDTVALNTIVATVKNRLENWLSYQSGERAFLFYYNQNWTTLIGYPAGHGQDGNINDHHFHWGYFIHAASFMEQYEPGWANQWGGMVNLLVRDAASPDRNDSLFPFLRNYSPFAGHCWANGFASFPQGNDQESTSESMQFNSALIHWGSVTNNIAIRDLGIFLYTTEQSAIEEYWFDQSRRNFGPSQTYSLVSRVWGNSYDNGTFWTADIAASYGIELYPIHGGSLYLGHDTTYAASLWAEMTTNTGILSNQVNPNLWHDTYWKYLSLTDAARAVALYDAYPERVLKFGISDAQTYHWLHAMNSLGKVDISIRADHPLAVVFTKGNSKTYVAHNYSNSSIVVNYTNGFRLTVPAKSTATSRDINVRGVLSSDFDRLYPGGSTTLKASVFGSVPDSLVFVMGDSVLGSINSIPYEFTAQNIPAGKHSFYVRIYRGNNFVLSNILSLTAGKQLPFGPTPALIPGSFDAADYDIFEGGSAAGIAYYDSDPTNQGNYRTDEGVDANQVANEGNTVGWINPGEWLEYTLNVQTAGFYNLTFRYASGNNNGGGPFHIIQDQDTLRTISGINSTSGWNNWSSRTINFVPLKSGEQVLRIAFEQGEFNLGRLTFSYNGPLPYSQPTADAGPNQLVQIPTDSALLSGLSSIDPQGNPLHYQWEQMYGPSNLSFDDDTMGQTYARGLTAGVYLIRLTVDNGIATDWDEMYLISSANNNVAPQVSLIKPFDQAIYLETDTVEIQALASDLNDSIHRVEFYANSQLIGVDSVAPYQNNWTGGTVGNHNLYAIAYDYNNASGTSANVSIRMDPAPPCRDTSSNGEFLYEFSPAKNNPTITFIPTLAGMGTPTCILYYGTSASGPLPGYGVTPNVPFQLNASQGSTIYFYYTYTYPGQGQHDNSANKDSYVIGSCSVITQQDELENEEQLLYYPNPVKDILNIVASSGTKTLEVYDASAKLISRTEYNTKQIAYKMGDLKAGMYFFRLIQNQKSQFFKVIR